MKITLVISAQEANQTATSKNLTVSDPNNLTATSNSTVSDSNVQLNQTTATSESKNSTVNVQELNQTVATSESKNLTVINPNVQDVNQIAATNTSSTQPENLTQVNGTTDQTNTNQTENTNLSDFVNNGTDTNSTNAQVDSSATLTTEEMQNIRGYGLRRRRRRCWNVDTPRRSPCPRHRERVRAFGRGVETFGRDVAIGGAAGAGTGFLTGKVLAPFTKGISIPAMTAAGALQGATYAGINHVLTRAWPERR